MVWVMQECRCLVGFWQAAEVACASRNDPCLVKAYWGDSVKSRKNKVVAKFLCGHRGKAKCMRLMIGVGAVIAGRFSCAPPAMLGR